MIPTCHRTLVMVDEGYTSGSPCIGSACALWIPAPPTYTQPTEAPIEGACADNPTVRRVDPAKEQG